MTYPPAPSAPSGPTPYTPQSPAIDLDKGETPSYNPTEADLEVISDVDDKFEKWSRERRPHEPVWFVNAAMWRGQQYTEWNTLFPNSITPTLPVAPSHRIRLTINKVFPKVRARQAKFLKGNAHPTVHPFSNDIEAREDARMTEKGLDYFWRKADLDSAYQETLDWANKCGHGYWWLSWDPNVMGKVKIKDEMTGQDVIEEANLGDVSVEVDGTYSLLISEPGISKLGKQPEILRYKIRTLDYIRTRFPDTGPFVTGEGPDTSGLRYEKQLALLSAGGSTGVGMEEKAGKGPSARTAIVKELFCAPTGLWPKGRYRVVANGVLLKSIDELPYGFWDIRSNPYPVIDFPDLCQAGQYWSTTVLEQLVTPQREYNLLRSKVADQIRAGAFPKLLVAVQHRVPASAWTTAPGEMVPYVAQPNIPPPEVIQPGNIALDVWKCLEMLEKEMQDISHIYPESEGRVGEATSGFQTNLLQEAGDVIHETDIRQHERAKEEAAIKIRRLMKQGYTLPRLLSISGHNDEPEALEFSAADIDEHAEIVVEAGSGLPMLKAARIQSLMELYNAGLLGNPQDPEVQRRTVQRLEMGTVSDAWRDAREDDEAALLENKAFREGKDVRAPEFFQNHDIHYKTHTSQLKSAESQTWEEQKRLRLLAHVILHVKFQNPQSAILLAQQYGMPELVQDLMQPQGASVTPGPPTTAGPPPPGAAGSPPPGAPNPAQAQSGAQQFNPESGMGAQGANTFDKTAAA